MPEGSTPERLFADCLMQKYFGTVSKSITNEICETTGYVVFTGVMTYSGIPLHETILI